MVVILMRNFLFQKGEIIVKSKYLLRILVLLAILVSAFGAAQQVQAQSGTVQIVMRSLTLWDSIYTGYVDTSRYEKWPLGFTESHNFTVTATPTSTGGLSPLILLLDGNSNEISRSVGTLTSVQPTGSYYIQIQPETSAGGTYSLTIRETQTSETPSVSIVFDPATVVVGETATAIVSLNHVPAEGYTSVEFTCTYNPSQVEVSNITANTDLFGADPAVAVNGPQNGTFIVAIAGSNGNKAVADGAAFTFIVKGLQVGQASIECRARVSKGNNTLTEIDFTGGVLIITDHGTLTGKVLASKPVTVRLLNADQTEAASVTANTDGTFSLTAPAGVYTVTACAEGFLDAQGTIALTAGVTSTMPQVSLLAGDIDNNAVIDQFDAMTIGMSYNTPTPAAADLNNDGTINVLDLELLANNYRKVGPIVWQ
jgi:hypothetical protein